jgi:threonine/homoserine/homoserine lactone efflux protein
VIDPGFLLRGLAIGFSIAAPVGPIGVLCIRRTLAEGRAVGFVSGLGAATADATYGGVAAFGLTVIARILVDQQTWLRLVGGLFLVYLGVRTLLSRPAEQAAGAKARRGLPGAYLSTLALTLTNPATILSFVAIFAGLGLASDGGDAASAVTTVVGVFLGSALWWLLLSGGVGFFRDELKPGALVWVNRTSGPILVSFGAIILIGVH